MSKKNASSDGSERGRQVERQKKPEDDGRRKKKKKTRKKSSIVPDITIIKTFLPIKFYSLSFKKIFQRILKN